LLKISPGSCVYHVSFIPKGLNSVPRACRLAGNAAPRCPQVGYKGDDGTAVKAAGARRRHPPPAAHRYETAADGHTREVHGGMLGPDEEELIQSDDSDKVGYA
jgi:hypothetical protein